MTFITEIKPVFARYIIEFIRALGIVRCVIARDIYEQFCCFRLSEFHGERPQIISN